MDESGHQFYWDCTHVWCTQDLVDPLFKWVISSTPALIGLLHSLHQVSNLAVNDLLLLLAGVPPDLLQGALCELLFRGKVLDRRLEEHGAAFLMSGGVCASIGGSLFVRGG